MFACHLNKLLINYSSKLRKDQLTTKQKFTYRKHYAGVYSLCKCEYKLNKSKCTSHLTSDISSLVNCLLENVGVLTCQNNSSDFLNYDFDRKSDYHFDSTTQEDLLFPEVGGINHSKGIFS